MRLRRHRLVLGIAALLATGTAILVVWQVWSSCAQRRQYDRLLAPREGEVQIDRGMEARIEAFCGDCHAVPRAESFHRDVWHDEVLKGYEFHAKSGRSDLDPPPVHLTVDYFRRRAPEQLAYPQPEEAATKPRVTFRVQKLALDPHAKVPPAISHLRSTALRPKDRPVLLACDMRSGRVVAVDLRDRQPKTKLLARLQNPCHVEPCDLDRNQTVDLLVADLGSSSAIDHDRGRVVWLRGQESEDVFEEVVVASGLGRVADARPADFDGDGDLDLVVADFGLHRTGKILLLRNVASPRERPRFEPETLDLRPGAINVPVHDFDGDGRPDFVALVSQEYECVELFLNQGGAKFHRQTLWRAPDLTFGSSSIELLDLDGDGDLDVLYANGDAFDNMYVSPWHGVQWIENLGPERFQYHRLTDLPGACRVQAGDFDHDGDLDIVATAWLPLQFQPDTLKAAPLASIVLLEQISPGRFVRHTLETGFPHYAALEVGDFDGDGDLDFAVGVHVGNVGRVPYWLAVWWNQRNQPTE